MAGISQYIKHALQQFLCFFFWKKVNDKRDIELQTNVKGKLIPKLSIELHDTGGQNHSIRIPLFLSVKHKGQIDDYLKHC